MTTIEAIARIRDRHDRTLGHTPTSKVGYCAEPDGISATYCEIGVLLSVVDDEAWVASRLADVAGSVSRLQDLLRA